MKYPADIRDQIGSVFVLKAKPKRIISLVPSQTELLADLDLDAEIIAITKFCIHPDKWFREKIRIGGTKQLDIEAIRKLQPDLIIGNKEENERSQIEILQREFPVWMSDISDLSQALEMIVAIGSLTGTENKAQQICTDIKRNFTLLLQPKRVVRTLYFIWQNPYMCAGTHTFISDMLDRCGLQNIAPDARYPELTEQDIIDLQPDLILLSSEPYPFSEKHATHFRKILPYAEIKCVDGEMFSWYGSRLLKAPGYFNTLLTELR